MSGDTRKAAVELRALMLKKTLFVAINRVAAPVDAIEPARHGSLCDPSIWSLCDTRRLARKEIPTKAGVLRNENSKRYSHRTVGLPAFPK